MDIESMRNVLRLRREDWFVQALYDETKNTIDWSVLLEELNAYVQEGTICYWDVPRPVIAVLRKRFPSLRNFTLDSLHSFGQSHMGTGLEKGLLRGAIRATERQIRYNR